MNTDDMMKDAEKSLDDLNEEYEIPKLTKYQRNRVKDVLLGDSPPSSEEINEFKTMYETTDVAETELVKTELGRITERAILENDEVVYITSPVTDQTVTRALARKKIGYELALNTGIPTVPHVFGDNWVATPEINRLHNEFDFRNFRDLQYIDDLVTLAAQLTAVWSWDFTFDIFINENHELLTIDVTPMFLDGMNSMYQAYSAMGIGLVARCGYPPEILDIYTKRTRDLATYIYQQFPRFIPKNTYFYQYHPERYHHFRNQLPYLIDRLPITHNSPTTTLPLTKSHGLSHNIIFEDYDDHWTPIDEFAVIDHEYGFKKAHIKSTRYTPEDDSPFVSEPEDTGEKKTEGVTFDEMPEAEPEEYTGGDTDDTDTDDKNTPETPPVVESALAETYSSETPDTVKEREEEAKQNDYTGERTDPDANPHNDPAAKE